MTEDEVVEKARNNLWAKNKFQHGDETLVGLIRPEVTRPLHAPWRRGKEAYLIGADLSGNFFLRHCDSTVRYWNHSMQKDCERQFHPGLEPNETHPGHGGVDQPYDELETLVQSAIEAPPSAVTSGGRIRAKEEQPELPYGCLCEMEVEWL